MDMVLSIVALAAVVMIAGAIWRWRRDGASKQVWLMLVLAAVMIVNVLIWAVPDKNGTAPLGRAAEDVR